VISAIAAAGVILGFGSYMGDSISSPMLMAEAKGIEKKEGPAEKEKMQEEGAAPASSTDNVAAKKKKNNTNARSAYSVKIGKKMPEEVACFVEVAKGSRNKYEWDEELGHITLDRVLHSAVFYPHNYGFVPQTLCGDGDPLDVLIMGDDPLQPGCFVDVRPIGYLVMKDEKGTDEKLLAVAAKDPRLYEVRTIRNVPIHVLDEITQFFETYKTLEKNKWVKVGAWKGTTEAKQLIEETHRCYLEEKDKGAGSVFEFQS